MLGGGIFLMLVALIRRGAELLVAILALRIIWNTPARLRQDGVLQWPVLGV